MNLHRTTGQPDWADLDKSQYGFWQQVAAHTRGVVTPGNAVTICGLALVAFGLVMLMEREYWTALGLIVTGRLLDLVDGWLADITKTKSPLGELMDAAADKLGTFATIGVLAIAEVAPIWILVGLVVPHIVIAVIAAVGRLKNKQLHPSRAGKISMALLWVAIAGFIALAAYESELLGAIVYGAAFLAIGLVLYATVDYASQLARD